MQRITERAGVGLEVIAEAPFITELTVVGAAVGRGIPKAKRRNLHFAEVEEEEARVKDTQLRRLCLTARPLVKGVEGFIGSALVSALIRAVSVIALLFSARDVGAQVIEVLSDSVVCSGAVCKSGSTACGPRAF